MSRYTEARYANAEKSIISVLYDGKEIHVPTTPGNAEYGDIVREGIPVADFVPEPESYITLRQREYGSAAKQIEFIAENGVDALVARNLAIKQKYPKP